MLAAPSAESRWWSKLGRMSRQWICSIACIDTAATHLTWEGLAKHDQCSLRLFMGRLLAVCRDYPGAPRHRQRDAGIRHARAGNKDSGAVHD